MNNFCKFDKEPGNVSRYGENVNGDKFIDLTDLNS